MSSLEGVKVGDELYKRDANERLKPGVEPPKVTIVKVGPKRVAYEVRDRLVYANIETGRVDDWGWLETIDHHREQAERVELVRRLKPHGLEPRLGAGDARGIPITTLREIVRLLDESSPES